MAIQTFNPIVGGAELQLERLLPYLAARGANAEVVTRSVPDRPRREIIAGTTIHRTRLAGESPLASIVFVAGSLAHILRRRRGIDLVHAHGALSPATIVLGAQALGVRCLVTVLGTGDTGDLVRLAGKPVGKFRSRALVRRAWFIALSAEIRDELIAKGVPVERIFSIPNGVDCAIYRPAAPEDRMLLRDALGLPQERFIGAFVGRLHPVKQVATLLEAAARLSQLHLVLAGDGPQRESLEQLAHDLRIADRTHFLGLTQDVAEILPACNAFLLPSLGEGMSNALMEAMACGLACIASSAGGVRELFGDDRGIVVGSNAVEGWAEAIDRLMKAPDLQAKLGGAAADYIEKHFSIEATADRLLDAYRTTVRQG